MSYREQDIKHETADFWVLAVGPKGFEVYQTGITHSTRVASIGHGEAPALGLARAIAEADKRQVELDAYRQREGLRAYPLGGVPLRTASPKWTITQIIREVRDEFLTKGKASSFWHINDGLCSDFAREVLETLPGGVNGKHGFRDVENLSFMNTSEGEGESWDWNLLREHWGITTPDGLSKAEFESISFGQHVWITDGSMHYDAECPEGVKDFFDLPIFKSYIDAAKEKASEVARPVA